MSCNVPAILATTRPGQKISDVMPTDLEMVVFKKSVGHSSKDVHVLRRNKDSQSYECFLTKSLVNFTDLQSWIDSNECIVEQSLSTFQEIIPMDFKCYLIDGSVEYIAVINRNSTKPFLSYFDAKSLEQINFNDIFADIPRNWLQGFGPYTPELRNRIHLAKAEAERIARETLNVRGLIVSLDMYVTPRGNEFQVWLGEITPRPGALHSNWLKRDFVRKLFKTSDVGSNHR